MDWRSDERLRQRRCLVEMMYKAVLQMWREGYRYTRVTRGSQRQKLGTEPNARTFGWRER